MMLPGPQSFSAPSWSCPIHCAFQLLTSPLSPWKRYEARCCIATLLLFRRLIAAMDSRAWLESEKRLQLVAFAREAGLLDPRHTSHRILEGHVLMVDCVWSDTPAEGESKADGKGGPELATWRLVSFTILNVWMASMLLSWPAGGLGDTAIATFGLPVGMLVSQFITVISVRRRVPINAWDTVLHHAPTC